jgi:DNA repair protein RadC
MIILENTRCRATDPKSVARALQRWLRRLPKIERDKEHGLVLILNVRHRVTFVDLVSVGILNACLLHPREIYRTAISLGASEIIFAHNHPSGECEPSDEDIQVTRRLEEAGAIIGIQLLDHIIVSRSTFYSFKERGLL